MTPAEHAKKAEALLEEADAMPLGWPDTTNVLLMAQVHATLSLRPGAARKKAT